MQRQRPLAMRPALFLAAAIACSSDETTGPQTLQIAVSTPSISVQCGGSRSLTASLTRGGGFAGPVTMSVGDLPPGVTITFAPDELSGITTTTTINIAVAHSAVPGSYTIAITASASIDEVTTAYVLNIMEAPGYSLSTTEELSMDNAGSVSTTIQITRVGGYAGAVSLALAPPLPTGIQGAFQPASTVGNSSTLTLTASTAVAPGRYLITVNGASGTLPTRTLTINLTVTTSEPPDFELVVQPSALTVKAGESVLGSVLLIPSGGYGKYADLSLVSPPAGISAVFFWYYGGVASMTISVAPTVPPGAYELTLQGTAEVGTHTVPFTLTVTAAEDVPTPSLQ